LSLYVLIVPEAASQVIAAFRKYDSFAISHWALLSLPWDVIFTTNFDTLVEKAAASAGAKAAGSLAQRSEQQSRRR
jgi:hypothetical protein